MTLVSVKWQGNNQAWFTTNAAVVYPADITIYCNEAPNYGQYKYTDGVTALSALAWLGGSGGGQVGAVAGTSNRITVDATDPANPIVNIAAQYDTAITNEIAAAVATRPLVLFKSTNPVNHVGTVNNTRLDSVECPAGTFGANDMLNIRAVVPPNTAITNSRTFRIYVNTTDTLVGATLLATYSFTNSNRNFIRNFWFNNTLSAISSVLTGSTFDSDEYTPFAQFSASYTTTAFDFSQTCFIIFAAQNAVAADGMVLVTYEGTLKRNALL